MCLRTMCLTLFFSPRLFIRVSVKKNSGVSVQSDASLPVLQVTSGQSLARWLGVRRAVAQIKPFKSERSHKLEVQRC